VRQLRPDPGAGLKILRLFTDGASRGNPGPSGLGVVIEDDQGMRLRGLHRWLGVMTNNEAEYHALIEGLKAVEEWKPDRLELYLDSNLVVEQIKGGYRIKKPELQQLAARAAELLGRFPEFEIKHVERAKNRGADYLANVAIDEHVKKPKRPG
jgi:ribonuclease HI